MAHHEQEIFNLMTDKPYFEHAIEINDLKCSVDEEQALHLLRITKLHQLVSCHAEAETNREILEFVTDLKVEEDGSLISRVLFGIDDSHALSRYKTRDVRLS